MSTSSTPPPEGPDEHLLEEGHAHPRGTLLILLIWMAALIGFWGYIYSLLFLGR